MKSMVFISPSDSVAIRFKSLRFCMVFLTRLCSSSIWHIWRFFGSSFLPQKKEFVVRIPGSFVCFESFLSTKFILQLTDISSFSFYFSFPFWLSSFLFYTAGHDIWNKALFSRKTSSSVNLFCRVLHLHFRVFGKPSKVRNPFKLSGIIWKKLFSGSKPEKQILFIKQKFPITGFAFPSLKIYIYLL